VCLHFAGHATTGTRRNSNLAIVEQIRQVVYAMLQAKIDLEAEHLRHQSPDKP
jgi:hypothetical protein